MIVQVFYLLIFSSSWFCAGEFGIKPCIFLSYSLSNSVISIIVFSLSRWVEVLSRKSDNQVLKFNKFVILSSNKAIIRCLSALLFWDNSFLKCSMPNVFLTKSFVPSLETRYHFVKPEDIFVLNGLNSHKPLLEGIVYPKSKYHILFPKHWIIRLKFI